MIDHNNSCAVQYGGKCDCMSGEIDRVRRVLSAKLSNKNKAILILSVSCAFLIVINLILVGGLK